MRTRTVSWWLAYAAVMAALTGTLVWARSAVIARLSTPEALAEWNQWKAGSQELSRRPGPVALRPAKADEPPALILMRDHFGAILAVSLAIGSFLFGFLAVAIRGSLRHRPPVAEHA